MAHIGLCPKCGGRLVAIGERTGGFSGTKAVVGAAVAGPVGVAAGALGKKLVTLKCEKCGYTIETDPQTASNAEAIGTAAADAAWRMSMLQPNAGPTLQVMSNPRALLAAYSSEQQEVYSIYGLLHRKEAWEQLDAASASRAEEAREILAQAQEEARPIQAKLDACRGKKADYEKELSDLGFFKFSEKSALKAKLAALDAEAKDLGEQVQQITAQAQEEADALSDGMVETCRALAMDYMEKYAPAEWKNVLRVLYSLMPSKPTSTIDICKEHYDALGQYVTCVGLMDLLKRFYNPFVYLDEENPSITCINGAELRRDAPLPSRAVRIIDYHLTDFERTAKEMYGENYRPYEG